MRDAFQCHVAASLDCSFVVLLEQERSDEAGDGVLVGEDADHVGASLDLAVQAFERIGRMQLGAMPGRERHIGQHILLGGIHELGWFGHAG